MTNKFQISNFKHPSLHPSPGEGRERGRGRTVGVLLILFIGVVSGFFLRELLREKPVSAKLVTISSRNLSFQVATTAKTVGEVLLEQNFHNAPFIPSYLKRGEGELLASGQIIEIQNPISVSLIDAGNETQVTTTAATVNDLLYEQKIGLAATDQVKPGLGSFLGEGINVVIDRIVDLEVTERKAIPFEIRQEHDPSIYYGGELVLEPGREGKKEQKFLITYKNGVEVKRKLMIETILEKPWTEIRKFGTRIEIEQTEEGRASWYATKVCLSALGGCAAHPFYDKGRFARVTSLASGKSIIVQINDRGPELDKHPDRVIDLDATTYKALAPLGSGTIGVRVELLRK